MSFTLEKITILVAAYLVAAIPFGLVVSQLVAGRDVRQQGSGNIGATNVARVMGKKWGILVLFLDALKGFAVVKAAATLGDATFTNVVAVAAIMGHCYPVYLKFKGGKGVATSLGVVAALSWSLVGFLFGVFLAAFLLSRRVSVGSLTAALALPLLDIFILGQVMIPAAAWIMTVLIWWKHRENIKRLMGNQEPKFF